MLPMLGEAWGKPRGVVGPSRSTCRPMDRLFDKKSKKTLKSSRRHISLGIPANTAVGPLGFRAELDIGPKGEMGLSHRNLAADRSDSSTVTLDKGDTRASRIVFNDKRDGDQGGIAPETSAAGAVVGEDERGNDHTGEYS